MCIRDRGAQGEQLLFALSPLAGTQQMSGIGQSDCMEVGVRIQVPLKPFVCNGFDRSVQPLHCKQDGGGCRWWCIQAVIQRLPGLFREASCQLNARLGRPCTASGVGWVLPLEQVLRCHPQCSAVVGGAGVGLTDRIE